MKRRSEPFEKLEDAVEAIEGGETEVDLHCGYIGDDGVKRVAAAVDKSKTLEWLDLSDNRTRGANERSTKQRNKRTKTS